MKALIENRSSQHLIYTFPLDEELFTPLLNLKKPRCSRKYATVGQLNRTYVSSTTINAKMPNHTDLSGTLMPKKSRPITIG